MRRLERGGERIEVDRVDAAVTVRRFEGGALVGESVHPCASVLKAKFFADRTCAREIAAGFDPVGRDDAIVALSHAELMAEIERDPDDHDARLVLADWLTEHGDPWGQVIAVQYAKEHLAADDPDRYDELDRADLELRFTHASRLWGELAETILQPVSEHPRAAARYVTDLIRSEWECGFVREVMLESATPETFAMVIRALATLPMTSLLRTLYLDRFTWREGMIELVGARRWSHLRELHLGVSGGVDTRRLLPVLADTCTPVLDELSVEGTSDTDQLCYALLNLPLAKRLRTLALDGSRLSPAGCDALTVAPFTALESLRLTGRGPRDAAVRLRGVAKHVVVDLRDE